MAATNRRARSVTCANYIASGAPLPFADAMQMERQLLAEASADYRSEGRRGLRIALWQTPRAIVLPSGMLRRSGMERAAEEMAHAGWPVHERHTGGDLTPQFDGILNVSMAYVLLGAERSISVAYDRLTQPLISFLETVHGVAARTRAVPGAFCDGTYNLVVGGKKVAGTAQRWRLVNPGRDGDAATAVLAHAAILCNGDLGSALAAVNRFFAASGIDRRIDPGVHATLSDVVGADAGTPAALASAFANYTLDGLVLAGEA